MTHKWGCVNNFKYWTQKQISLGRNHLKALSLLEDVLTLYVSKDYK